MFLYKQSKEELPLVPLNEAEKHHLETIYFTRLRTFCLVYLVMFAWLTWDAFFLSDRKMYQTAYRTKYGNYAKRNGGDYEIFGHDLTVKETYWLVRAPIILLLSISGSVLFYKRIYKYRKDLKLGHKEKVAYTIIRKSHFPMTNQYYFSFDNPDYMHYEVDADLFFSMNEGDSVFIYRGKYSKHVFEKDARFTLM